MTPAEILRRDLATLSAALSLEPAGARLEIRVLLGHALGVNRAWLIAHEHDELPAAPLEKYQALLARRLAGEPVAYLLGEKEFFGRSFHVTPAVLVPRPETELLVELALEKLPPAGRALDLGTGSGCIAITLALERPDCGILAVEQSAEALSVAKQNAVRLGARLGFYPGSWFQALPADTEKFDLIVSNPPYVAEGDSHLAALAQEPAEALASGADGMDDIRLIVQGAPAWLKPGGWLLFEHGWDHGEACRDLLKQAGFCDVETRADLAGIGRVTLGHVCARL
ncbi:peptide chain release factor N(5)-glutamine methyltransferase [Betaproteobacteria bacterium SCN2]|jgi:release factor glutamine methyltransferase|nr:peptide chain release factor N(5)-glutamine methyltransferase [Betaproteobacteria bacterium SCN2]